MREQPRITALAGGVGGAKLADGLQRALRQGTLSVVVNTADDFKLWGLYISPDIDTVMYTLAGLANPTTGWGLEGDTWSALGMLGRYGRDAWFRIGDMDMATHLLRTQMLSEGRNLTEATSNLAASLGIKTRILPMCDEPVESMVQTEQGALSFQDYFVRRKHSDPVTGVIFRGIEKAQPTEEAVEAVENATAIVFCPSNPIVSIGPILAVPGMKRALERTDAPKVAVSPIIGGAALKGPAADMLRTLGHEVSAVGVAALYKGLIDLMIIDNVDAELGPRIREMGMEVEVAQTIMNSDAERHALARRVIAICDRLNTCREQAAR
ncbi:MAG: 2-phospho-L-lactate transferase [Chloroflexi bacterium]|nr:2-phospho-L-lactate transferase [Chloroflexota bacterium]